MRGRAPNGGCTGLQARPNMVKSTVVDNETGKSIDSTVRTSTGTFFGREVRCPTGEGGY